MRSPVTSNMASYSHYLNSHNNLHLLILLLLLSTTQVALPAEGRTALKLLQVAETQKEVGEEFVLNAMLGSRPPRCERRCIACGGHCEAVQVPALLLGKDAIVGTTARDDDYSNYKPLSWKCKCGDTILNP